MIKWKASLIFLCIFLTGGVTGYFTGLRMACEKAQKKPTQQAQAQGQPRRPVEEWSKRFQKDFATRVGVTSEQQTQLDPFIQSAQSDYRSLRESFIQQMADISEKLDGQVMALLDDEQKPKYEQMIKERLERLKKMEAEHAKGEHPPKSDGPQGPKPTPSPKVEKQPTPPVPASEAPATVPAQPASASGDSTVPPAKTP